MKTIGTDVSLDTCRTEGYIMMQYNEKRLMPGGELDPQECVRFFAHAPDYVLFEMYGHENPFGVKRIILDVWMSASDVWELYQDKKQGIDSMIGSKHDYPEGPYDLLCLASDVSAYCGLE